MLAVARLKARGRAGVRFSPGEAGAPPLTERAFDAVLCRHVLRALPNPEAALQAWMRLLRPSGRLVLMEGRWSTGADLPSQQTVAHLRCQGLAPTVESLTDPRYWGGPIVNERYVVSARSKSHRGRAAGTPQLRSALGLVALLVLWAGAPRKVSR